MRRVLLVLAVALVSALAGFAAYDALTPTIRTIPASYAFDVTNPEYVAGYADTVVIGRVEQVVETQSERQRTLYRVQVVETLEGSPAPALIARQLGYVDGNDRFILEDQPMLSEGRTYLLALTNASQGQHTVIAGPQAVIEVAEGQRDEIVEEWRGVIARQEFPPGVPR